MLNSLAFIKKYSLLILCISCLTITACSPREAADEVKDVAGDMKEAVDDVKEAVNDIKEDENDAKNDMKKLLSTEQLEALEKNDPYLWLEEVEGKKALDWVSAQNKESLSYLQNTPGYQSLFDKNLAVYDSKERIENPSMIGNYVYNYWRDATHTRGISRRTSLDHYLSGNPKWETVLDMDAIAKAENKNWVYKGRVCLAPDYTRCILQLSDGGSDAVLQREYDLDKKEFITDGFSTTVASRGSVAWLDQNTLLIGTNFGKDSDSNSMTDSDYARIIKLWKRGTPLAAAKTIFEGETSDVGVFVSSNVTPEANYPLIYRAKTFYTRDLHLIKTNDTFKKTNTVKLELPDDISPSGFFKEQMLLQTKSEWKIDNRVIPQGALISIGVDNFLGGKRNFTIIREPTERSSISSISNTKDSLLVNVLNNVSSELHAYDYSHGKWTHKQLETPKLGSLSVVTVDEKSNQFFYNYRGFLSPTTLYHVDDNGNNKELDSLPNFFDTAPYQVQQFEVSSKDGTQIPYFMVSKKEVVLDGSNPTILYGYGGFEISMNPSYSATVGMDWLEQGGVYVLSNIRGGGEFGPQWHHAALKENRMRAYEDFFAIAEDLISRKVTSPKHLGIRGGSNGGLLMGVSYTKRPDLFNAVACGVPLLDMKRFNKLLAGASWMGEYGDPDIPEQWDYIKEYSPYHNLKKDEEYPKVFFYTSTKDDRVHPGHARKMVALMEEYGHPYLYYENTEGGHAASSNNKQTAKREALIYSYFKDQLFEK